jgi:tripartite-type tricarboxylate transporter receptor subunit TctC
MKLSTAAALAIAALSTPAIGETYPSKPIRIVVPSTPGGSVDTLARAIAGKLSEKWHQQVIVDNRPGAGGAIGADLVAKSAPDGYNVILVTIAAGATNVSLRKNLPYDPVKDFAPITLVAKQHLMLLVHPSVPAKNVKELIALAKARPGQLSFASAGNGTGGHLSGELFKLLAGINLLHVPYKGVAPAFIDVLAGQVSMTFSSLISGYPHYKSGRLRGLAVTSLKRSSVVPELPTMPEAGVKGYESATWYGFLAPAGTPPDVVAKLNREIVAIIDQPELHDRLTREGAEPVGDTPAQFGAFIRSEIEKWGKVIRAAGIKAG